MDLHDNTDAIAIIDPSGELSVFGNAKGRYPLASITKILTTYVVTDAHLSGFIDIDANLGTSNISFADLLSHVSGIRNNDKPIEPRTKRIYTNKAYDRAEEELIFSLGPDFSIMTIGSIFAQGIKHELDFDIEISSSCASSGTGTFDDLIKLLFEMRNPTLIDSEMHQKLVSPYCPGLPGIVPGFGHFSDNLWGIGYELHGTKTEHWMGSVLSEKSYGHFGLGGAYVVHDPINNISIASVSSIDFGPWAKEYWPGLNDSIAKKYV